MSDHENLPSIPEEEPVLQEEAPKKKRTLTEAQRLAFLKGREKRMLNIQKKKEEKEEAIRLLKEEKEPVETAEPTPLIAEARKPEYDEDAHAKKVADYVYMKLMSDIPQPPPQRAPRKPRRPKAVAEPTPVATAPVVPPPAKNIAWC